MKTRYPYIVSALATLSFLLMAPLASAQTSCPQGTVAFGTTCISNTTTTSPGINSTTINTSTGVSLCQSGIPADPNGSAQYTFNSGQLCTDFSGCQNLATTMTPTQATADALAASLGATVTASNNILGGSGTYNTVPVYTLTFPNGYSVEAGYVAYLYNTGFTSQDAAFQQIYQGACGTTGSVGGTSGGTTGSTGGTTGSTGTSVTSGGSAAMTTTINTIYRNTQPVAQTAIGAYNQVAGSPITLTTNGSAGTPDRSGVIGLTNGAYVSANQSSSFPISIQVAVSSLNVRSAPSTSASLSGSQTLTLGDQFIAVNEVVGESVSGNNLWWVSKYGNYVWSGGTTIIADATGSTQTTTTTTTTTTQTTAPTLSQSSTTSGSGSVTGSVGSTVTLSGGNFTSTGNTVLFGSGAITNISSSNGTSITFTIPSTLIPSCSPTCSIPTQQTVPGVYSVKVINANGTSNEMGFTVTASTGTTTTTSANSVTALEMNPKSGAVGTLVIITGAGYAPTGNTINFGNGVVPNVSSSNGLYMNFTVPSSITPACHYLPTSCMTPSVMTTPGVYTVSVTNVNGTSGTLNFTVTQ